MNNNLKFKIYLLKQRILFFMRRKNILRNLINKYDSPTDRKFLCKSCNEIISAKHYHGGFSDITAIYCSDCHSALYLRGEKEEPKWPDTSHILSCDYGREKLPLIKEFEEKLPKCICGGTFDYLNPPRCPNCKGEIMGDIYEGKPILKERDYYVLDFGTTFTVKELISQQGVREECRDRSAPQHPST